MLVILLERKNACNIPGMSHMTDPKIKRYNTTLSHKIVNTTYPRIIFG